MSMNIYIRAEREVYIKTVAGKFVSAGKQYQTFDAEQTRTADTMHILNSKNPKQAYIDVVLARYKDCEEPIYADDDLFGEKPPIGTKIYNWGKEHVEEFKDWCAEVEQDGYVIEYSMI